MSTHKHVKERYDNIIKEVHDSNLYRGLVLSNKMKILLVSQPTTDWSFVMMDVNIGSMCDPDDLPGLAHFCEHMLLLGTEKYPEQNRFSEYVKRNGGTYLAATFSSHTNYWFDIISGKLADALDCFAQFFLTPLFMEALTDLEINAINSEYKERLADDKWRFIQFERSSANPDHPFSKFGMGNRETLDIIPKQKGINVRNRLLEFHEKYYSANVMSLLIFGKESLDKLENMVIKYFCDIRNKEIEVPKWPEHPFTDEHFRTIWYIVPIKDIRDLHILFPLPDMQQFDRSSSANYISHLLGHKGEGSLFSALKTRGWCNYLKSYVRTESKDLRFLDTTVDLTEEGIVHINDIVQLMFEYINLLKSKGPIKWIYDECTHIENVNRYFAYRIKSDFLIQNLHVYSMNEVLCAQNIFTEWRPKLIEQVMKYLTPQKVRVLAIAKAYESIANDTERWYGIKYKKEKVSKETMDMWNTTDYSTDLKLPSKNEFIVTTFYPKSLSDVHEFPIILKNTSYVRLFYKRDTTFFVPQAMMIFNFVTPVVHVDPLSYNLTKIFVLLFCDWLDEHTYAASLAGLNSKLTSSEYGFRLSLDGYNDKQRLLLKKIIDQMINFKIDPKRFESIKEYYIRGLKNFYAEQPYKQASCYLEDLLSEQKWLNNELLTFTTYLSIDRLERFIPKLFSKVHVDCLIYGNVTAKEATDIVELIESKLTTGVPHIIPLLQRQLVLFREIKLEDGCHYLLEAENKCHKSSCIIVYYAIGLQSIKLNMLLHLLVRIIDEPCYNILRTNEQLGYMVKSDIIKMNVAQGLKISVQGDKHPRYVEKRIDVFLDSMLHHVSTMSEEKFKEYKTALLRLEGSASLHDQGILYWNEIENQQYNFNRLKNNMDCLKEITRQELLNFYEKYIHSKCTRRKLSIHVTPTAMLTEKSLLDETTGKYADWLADEGIKKINDISSFRYSQTLFPLLKPFDENFLRKGIRSCKL